MADVVKVPQFNIQVVKEPKPVMRVPQFTIQVVKSYYAESGQDNARMFLVM